MISGERGGGGGDVRSCCEMEGRDLLVKASLCHKGSSLVICRVEGRRKDGGRRVESGGRQRSELCHQCKAENATALHTGERTSLAVVFLWFGTIWLYSYSWSLGRYYLDRPLEVYTVKVYAFFFVSLEITTASIVMVSITLQKGIF